MPLGGVGALIALTFALQVAQPAVAQAPGGGSGPCLTAEPSAPAAPPAPLRFGVAPLAAGSAGTTQLDPAPENREAAIAALHELRPGGRELILRLNRMFMSEGRAAVHRFARIVDRFARSGFRSELQVRYHPAPEQEGDMEAWREFVETAARVLGQRPSVTALSITNEANFPISGNTSDGSYEGVREAVVVGIAAAARELERIGRRDVELGFSVAWRYLPQSDAQFWDEIGARATPEFRAALDYVGLQIYPGLVWPPAPIPGSSAGDEVAEALTLLRDCYLPRAGLGDGVALWVTENGYPTNLGRTEESQAESLTSTLEEVQRVGSTLGVTDYRWFNLRDNRTGGSDLFDAVGLLRDDYSRKQSFGVLRDTIAANGTPRHAWRRCAGIPATAVGTPHRDRIRGTRQRDVIVARGGRDHILTRSGNDLVCAGAGADVVRGGPGRDRAQGGSGADRCRAVERVRTCR